MIPEQNQPHRVPLLRFFVANAIQLGLAFGLFAWLFPKRFELEMSQIGSILIMTVLWGIPLSLFEYLYHRYLLHSAVLPFMASMFRAHTLHHKLTDVKAPVKAAKPEMLVPVINDYPIMRAEQEESMMFPLYSLSIFYAIFLILVGVPGWLMFRTLPVFSSILITVTLFYGAYELWHAALHLPFERFWQPLLERKGAGKTVKRLYSFHLMHHWRPTCNLAIVGFWGVALWDYIFRTHRRPMRLPLKGCEVNYQDGKLARPMWPIGMIDGWQGNMSRWSRSVERFLAKVFLRKSFNKG